MASLQNQDKFYIDLDNDEPKYEQLHSILNTQKQLEIEDQFSRIEIILKNSTDSDGEFNVKLIIENMNHEYFDFYRLSIYKDYINDFSIWNPKSKFYNSVFYEIEWNEKKKTFEKVYVTYKTKTKTITQVQQEIERIKTIELD